MRNCFDETSIRYTPLLNAICPTLSVVMSDEHELVHSEKVEMGLVMVKECDKRVDKQESLSGELMKQKV